MRESLPDQGFEQRFRESCSQNLPGWSIAPQRELWLGAGLDTASGTLHEVDIVAKTGGLTAVVELKNLGNRPGKNDIIVFFAKIVDYLLANPYLASEEICLTFMSSNSFEPRGLAACLGLGIHPVASDLRPLPILVNNALIMEHELSQGLAVSKAVIDRFEDLCVQLHRLEIALQETWLDSRCDYHSESSLIVRSVDPIPVDDLGVDLRQANSDCTTLLGDFRRAKLAG